MDFYFCSFRDVFDSELFGVCCLFFVCLLFTSEIYRSSRDKKGEKAARREGRREEKEREAC